MIRVRFPNGKVMSFESDEDYGPNIMEMQEQAMSDDEDDMEYDSDDYYEDDPESIEEEIENPNPQGGESYRIRLPNGISIESDGETSDEPVDSYDTDGDGDDDDEEEDDEEDEDDEDDDEEDDDEDDENGKESFRINFPNGRSIESTPYGIVETTNPNHYSSEADEILKDFFDRYQ